MKPPRILLRCRLGYTDYEGGSIIWHFYKLPADAITTGLGIIYWVCMNQTNTILDKSTMKTILWPETFLSTDFHILSFCLTTPLSMPSRYNILGDMTDKHLFLNILLLGGHQHVLSASRAIKAGVNKLFLINLDLLDFLFSLKPSSAISGHFACISLPWNRVGRD